MTTLADAVKGHWDRLYRKGEPTCCAECGQQYPLGLVTRAQIAEHVTEVVLMWLREHDALTEMDGDAREAEGYDRGLAWGVSCAEAEARWQWELDRRGAVGAQIVSQRAQVIAGTIRQAISGDNAAALAREVKP